VKNNEQILSDSKSTFYQTLYRQMESLLDGETDLIANLSNAAALLNSMLSDINWVGFYRMVNAQLLVGPFQGNPACVCIAIGKGVCGTAVQQNATQLISDVHCFPGHIACDASSASELVIPLHSDGRIVGVLDIDSPSVNRFDSEDAAGLEKIAKLISESCIWHE
jgi:L-methionine (R)-S-oxide reductase